jgi:hypothetical protein
MDLLSQNTRPTPRSVWQEGQNPLLPTVRTSDASESAHRIAAVVISLQDLLDRRAKIAVFPFKTVLIPLEELL